LTRELHLTGVTFAGRVPPTEVSRFYQAADIFVQSPDIDNMPLSILEAFATGLPVVSTLMEPLVGLADALVVAENGGAFVETFGTLGRDALTGAQRAELAALCARNDYDVKFAEILQKLASFGDGREAGTRLEPLLHRPLGGDHFRQRNIAENAGQNVVEIMGDAAGEQAERFQFAGLVQFNFQLPIFRDVATDEGDADDAAGRVMNRCAAGHDHSLPPLP